MYSRTANSNFILSKVVSAYERESFLPLIIFLILKLGYGLLGVQSTEAFSKYMPVNDDGKQIVLTKVEDKGATV